MNDIYSTQKYYTMLNYFLKKLEDINKNTYWKINHNDSEFTFKWFCIICYHFKDNLKNQWYKSVEDYINESTFLSICADICNWTKHSEAVNDRSNKNITNWNSNTYIDFGINWVQTSNKFIIKIDWKDYDSLEFADNCLKEWDEYIKLYKISL